MIATTEPLLPLAEVTGRLQLRGQYYLGVRPIPVDRIIGSLDRSADFDRRFRPRHLTLRTRLHALGRAFPDGVFPAITVREVGGLYFVVDGHHRVALAHQLGMEYVDAEVTAIEISHRLTRDADVSQLIHTEQHRIFKERTRLLVRHPEAKIELSRPTGYRQLLDMVDAHAYQLSVRVGQLVAVPDATAHWYETEYLPAAAALHDAGLADAYRQQTKADIYLWVQNKRRQLQTANRAATWVDAALAARREGLPRREQRALTRERRRPLPRNQGWALPHPPVQAKPRIAEPQTVTVPAKPSADVNPLHNVSANAH
jgi:hypothetical protein